MNKLILFAGLFTISGFAFGQSAQSNNLSEEEMAIRKVIETETRTYHEADFDLNKQQWSGSSYTERQHGELKPLVGMPYVKGEKLFQLQEAYGKTAKPTGLKSRLSDYEAHISGTTAWTTYTQETFDAAGSVVDKQRAVRILERGAGGWKIVFMSQQKL